MSGYKVVNISFETNPKVYYFAIPSNITLENNQLSVLLFNFYNCNETPPT